MGDWMETVPTPQQQMEARARELEEQGFCSNCANGDCGNCQGYPCPCHESTVAALPSPPEGK